MEQYKIRRKLKHSLFTTNTEYINITFMETLIYFFIGFLELKYSSFIIGAVIGFFSKFIFNDLFVTILLSAIGGIVSFYTKYFLKQFMTRREKKKLNMN